ncbi:unnamed protein product [Schistosoma margrebowiei]|uniref:Mitochondrial import inner membrane translocase subunit Tim21 n=1 Tax=Schistosoma margrebowiei TaxID=48269 RepID=A0A183LHH5_9TREM|nr:unnamed protein product [Schistosoma margrebowiei]
MTSFVKLICFQFSSVKLSILRFPYQQWPVRPYRSASNSSITPSEKRENLPLVSITEKDFLTVTPYLCQRLTPDFLVHKTPSYDSWHDDKGRLHMAMKFYIKGNLASGVVHLEVVENESKEFDYRYLIVETEGGFSKKQIILRSFSEVDNPNL